MASAPESPQSVSSPSPRWGSRCFGSLDPGFHPGLHANAPLGLTTSSVRGAAV